jgi:polyhydroxyalkanoate synthesis regulator phasin
MKNERLKILSMLEEGKITAEEARLLLEAVKDSGGESAFGFGDETAEQRLQRFAKNVENFAREVGSRVESAYREVEPGLKKASLTVLERTADVIDNIAKTLNESIENARAKAAEEPADEPAKDDDAPKEN